MKIMHKQAILVKLKKIYINNFKPESIPVLYHLPLLFIFNQHPKK